MNDAATEAAYIMRHHPIKTISDILSVAKSRARHDDTGKGFYLDPDGNNDENGHAWAVVDAHTEHLQDPFYRAEAGLEPLSQD